MIKLAAFDIDGTLLNSNKEVLHSSREAIFALQKQGIIVVIATGRAYTFLPELIKKELAFDYFICSNGNDIRDQHGNCIKHSSILQEDIESLTNDFENTPYALYFQFSNRSYSYVNHDVCMKHFMKFVGVKDLLKNGTEHKNYHYDDLPLQAIAHMPKTFAENCRNKYPQYDIIAYCEDGYDIVLKGINKAVGLQSLCKYLSLNIDDTIAFGDHLNDVEMLKVAGVGIAMDNSIQDLKDVADFVSTSCDEDGIYNACLHYNLISFNL